MRFVQLLMTGRIPVNPEHTGWYSPPVMTELARRSRLRVTDVAFVDDDFRYRNRNYPGRSLFAWPILIANYPLCRIRPQLSETLCFVLEKETAEELRG